jgi:predicted DNA-binding ribbon-helix-helix protein
MIFHKCFTNERPYAGACVRGDGAVKSSVVKHSIVIAGRKTSVSLEDSFWKSLRQIAARRDETLSQLIANIDAERKYANLSSAIRLFVLEFYRDQIKQQDELATRAVASKASDLHNR